MIEGLPAKFASYSVGAKVEKQALLSAWRFLGSRKSYRISAYVVIPEKINVAMYSEKLALQKQIQMQPYTTKN